MILSGLLVSTALWANLTNVYVWVVVGVTLGFGLIGFYDDYLKVTKQTHAGFSGRTRLLIEFAVRCARLLRDQVRWPFTAFDVARLSVLQGPAAEPRLVLHHFRRVHRGRRRQCRESYRWPRRPCHRAGHDRGRQLRRHLLGDGNAVFAEYLQVNFVSGAGELAVLCGAILGAGLGFLWFNAPPASIFMGDTGSLALGGLLGTVAVVTKHEIVLGIIGGLFVLEAVSVIVQVLMYKLTKKRVFLMAPIHHHFEQLGWTEPQIVIRFWIIAVVLALAGLSTLKLR